MTTNSTTEINTSHDENSPENSDTSNNWYAPLVSITDPELLAQIADHPATDDDTDSLCDTLQNLLAQMDQLEWYFGSPESTNSHDIARKRAAEFAFGEFLKSLVLSGKKLIAEVQTLKFTYVECTCYDYYYQRSVDGCTYEIYGGHSTAEWVHVMFAQVTSLAEVLRLAMMHDLDANSYDPCGDRVFFTILPA